MELFSSKILLFGEYSIIKNSRGLAVPYDLFQGELTFSSNSNETKDEILFQFYNYLRSLEKKGELLFPFDFLSFEFDISRGLFFSSTIPRGFGVGSSGALCAAIFERYSDLGQRRLFRDRLEKSDLVKLKKIFAQMESFFHGSSSGFDPLISYYNLPIMMKGSDDLDFPQMKMKQEGSSGIFILNSKGPRKTAPLVQLFLEKCQNKQFDALCSDVLIPLTNSCISSFLRPNQEELFNLFSKLSSFQLEHFKAMIPSSLLDIWKRGLDSNEYAMKLCGAGGGGFLLGIAKDLSHVQSFLEGHEIRPILRF